MPKKQKTRRLEKRRSGRWLSIIIVSLLTVLIGLYLLAKFSEQRTAPIIKEKTIPPETKSVSLYFSNATGVKLGVEKRDIKKETTASEIKEVMEQLIKGPAEKFIRTIPEETKVLNVRLDKETAAIDFSADITTKHPGGSSAEIQTVYSIVNSIVFNFPEFKKVQILIDGKKAKTLAGHIDISLPLDGDKTK
ncbi:MAG: GerMN domain-containing protein [Deltaproteobacteria bacterium]|nr:GerMN domain-containing protein [Deltaproteobacteria bacterium]